MNKKIIMLLTNGFDPDVRVYKEAKYLVSNGFKVKIICWDRDLSKEYPEQEMLEGIEIIRFKIPSIAGSGKKQLLAFLKYMKMSKKYLKHNSCDYLHCNDIDGALVGYFARRRKTPMVFDMHEYYEDVGVGKEYKRRFWRWLTLFMIKRSEGALYENDLYLRGPYKGVKDKLLPLKNYPDSDFLQFVPKTESSVFRIGYHGAVRSQIPEFIALFEAVSGMEDVRVDINGGGPDYVKLKELEKKYKNVHVHGQFNGATELTGLYANTDIVFAGYRPTSSTRECAEVVKFFECILTGTPMILTKAYIGMANRIDKFGFGITCDTRDVIEIKKAIMKLKDNHDFRQMCSKNERKQAYKYDWKEAVKILDEVYKK